MSVIEKLLIPLIDENIKLSDIKTNDFCGVFTEDINHPGLDYIYLVFNYDIENLRPNLAINGIDSAKRIGNRLYHVYKFPRLNSDLKRIIKGDYYLLSNEGISKIYNFWKTEDSFIANYPFSRTIAKEKYSRTIPEEKYIPLCKKREPQGVTVEKQQPLGFICVFIITIKDRTKNFIYLRPKANQTHLQQNPK